MNIAPTLQPANRGSAFFNAKGSPLVGERVRWRSRAAKLLRNLADWVQPPIHRGLRDDPQFWRFLVLPGAERLDWQALDRGEVKLCYRATDPVWNDIEDDVDLVDLREHVRRLCMAAREIATFPSDGVWDNVANNLRLAYALTDLFAQTDVDGASMWCNPVADYETADSELTAKHLAATIVFSFVWTAWECLIESIAPGPGGKGAKGRDLVVKAAKGHIPHLRTILLKALELDKGEVDFGHRDMRRMISIGSIPGIAAEYLRQFRNRVTHGDLPKPEPGDWGNRPNYVADADPHLRRFHTNIRLVLLFMQILAIDSLHSDAELEAWLEYPCRAASALEQLHCVAKFDTNFELELDLNDEAPLLSTGMLG